MDPFFKLNYHNYFTQTQIVWRNTYEVNEWQYNAYNWQKQVFFGPRPGYPPSSTVTNPLAGL